MDKDLGVGSSKDRPSRRYLGRVPRNRPKTKTLRKVLYGGELPGEGPSKDVASAGSWLLLHPTVSSGAWWHHGVEPRLKQEGRPLVRPCLSVTGH